MKKNLQALYKLLTVSYKQPNAIEICIPEAGTLSQMLAPRRKYQIEKLKIIGDINQKDIQYICDMAGSKSSKDNIGNLSTLDLSEAEFISSTYDKNSLQTHTIPHYTFSNCKKLNKIIVPKNIAVIEQNAFYGCTKLTTIVVPKENNYYADINGVLFNKNKDTLIFYPKGRTGGYTIPNNIVTLRASIFQNCIYMTSVVIPESVTDIEEGAFAGCKHLKEITCLSPQPPRCNALSCFDGVSSSSCTLYIPKGTYSNYWLTQPWGNFTNIKEEKL